MRDVRLSNPIFKKHLASARAAVPEEPFEEIVDFCYLVPDMVDDWHAWRDEYGNLLRIHKNNHSLHIYENAGSKSIPTDIFMFSHPESIIKHSYWIMGSFDLDPVLWMLGNDGRLRIGAWKEKWLGSVAPLLSGMSVLRIIAKRYIDPVPNRVEVPRINVKFADVGSTVYTTEYPTTHEYIGEKINCLLSIK